jgi:hypothetical protein
MDPCCLTAGGTSGRILYAAAPPGHAALLLDDVDYDDVPPASATGLPTMLDAPAPPQVKEELEEAGQKHQVADEAAAPTPAWAPSFSCFVGVGGRRGRGRWRAPAGTSPAIARCSSDIHLAVVWLRQIERSRPVGNDPPCPVPQAAADLL